ncbi:MAG: FkbM family methyltransferase [Planctomycetota bacterium]
MNNFIRLISRFIFGKLLPRWAYPVLRGPLRGARFILGSLAGEGGGASVYFGLIEPEQTAALAESLKKGMTFFDVGANVGYYSLLGSRLVGPQGKVVAFEPALQNLDYLYRHTVLNKAGNVTIMSAACADGLSMAIFSAGENSATGHLAAEPGPGQKTPVLTVALDEVAQRLAVWPAVIKIDVEGAELSVLRGARGVLDQARPKIFLSTHSAGLREAYLAYLKEHGYAYEILSRDKLDPSEFLAVHSEEKNNKGK